MTHLLTPVVTYSGSGAHGEVVEVARADVGKESVPGILIRNRANVIELTPLQARAVARAIIEATEVLLCPPGPGVNEAKRGSD